MANRYGIGAAEFIMTVNDDQLLKKLAQDEAAARRASAKIKAEIDAINAAYTSQSANVLKLIKQHNDAADKAAKAAVAAAQQQQKAFTSLVTGVAGGAAAVAGFSLTMGTLGNVLADTASKTYAAAQAQFQLNAVYKEGAASFKAFTNSLANETKLLNTSLDKGVSILGNLQKNYGFTSEQIRNLTKIAVDAAAVHGVPLLDAFKSIEAAMRGEGEAAEKLGFTLNANFIKNNAAMSAEQRKLYFSLTDVTRAQIIYQEAIKQAGPYQNAAIDRTKTAIGKFDELRVSIEKLQISIGNLATGPMVKVAEGLIFATSQASKFVGFLEAIEKHTAVPAWVAALVGLSAGPAAIGLLGPAGALAVIAAGPSLASFGTSALDRRAKQRSNELVDNGAEQDAAAAIAQVNEEKERDRRAKKIQEEKALTDALKTVLDKREKDIKESADRNRKIIDQEIDAERKRYDAARAILEAEKHDRQEAAKDRKETALEAIRVEKEASDKQFEANIKNLETERDAKEKSADDRRDIELKRIERESEAVNAAAEEQIRQEEIKRDKRLKIAEETRDGLIEITRQEKQAALDAIQAEIAAEQNHKDDAIRAAEDTKKSRLDKLDREESAREKAFARRKANYELDKDNAIKAAEANKEAQLRLLEGIERERDRARDLEDRRIDEAKQAELRAIEDRNNATENGIEDEEKALRRTADARLRLIEDLSEAAEDQHRIAVDLIDEQLRASEAAHDQELKNIKAEGDARLKELDGRLRATDALEKAFENDQKNNALQDKLTVARRKGDPGEIARVEKEIADELLRQQFDSQRDALKATKDALKDEYDAKEDAAKTEYELRRDTLEQIKRDEQEAYRARKELLQDESRDINRTLEDALQAIADRKQAFSRSVDDEKRLIQDRYDALEKAISDQRYAEDEALRIRKEAVNDAYDAERAKITDHYDNPVSGVFARLQQQTQKTKEEFDKRKKTVNDAYEDERRKIEDHYDDPENGVFAKLHQQQTETERAFDARTRTIEAGYKAEQDAIKATYDDEETGSIPAIKRAVKATQQQLEIRKELVETSHKDERAQIKQTYDELIAAQKLAKDDADENYKLRTKAVNDSYDAEQKAIYATYDHPVNGLFKKQKDAHDQQIDNLNKQKTAWTDWETEVSKRIDAAKSNLEEFVKKIKELEAQGILTPGSVADQVEKDKKERGGAGGGSGVSVPRKKAENPNGEPYTIAFGFDRAYDPPIPGLPPRHRGVDLTLPGDQNGRGKPVGAFTNGTVIARTNDPNGGNGLLLQQDDTGLYEYYGHFDSRSVDEGDKVRRGDHIGNLGASGTEGFPHLHYEVRRNSGGDPMGSTIDPVPFMNGIRNPLGSDNGDNVDEEDLTVLRPFGPNGPAVILGMKRTDWFGKALKYAKKYDFSEPKTFAKQMQLESDNFSEDVIKGERKSSAGAIGIAQFMPDTAESLGVDPYDPIDSLKGAAKYMHALEQRYDGVRNALWAYNAGEGNLQDGFMPSETREYLRRLDKYRNGTMIKEPTLMLGLRTGEAGIAGETGQPERLLGVNATQQYDGNTGGTQMLHMPITLGNNVVEDLWIQGIKLTVKSGRSIGLPGIRVQ